MAAHRLLAFPLRNSRLATRLFISSSPSPSFTPLSASAAASATAAAYTPSSALSGPLSHRSFSSTTPTKKDSDSDDSNDTKKNDAQEGKDGKDAKAKSNPQPKILNENPPSGKDEPEDVRKHNEEMDQRAERASAGVKNEDTGSDKERLGKK